ncbi:MAG TPA: hypothetical protein VEV16_04785 [Daejeonella sp.]|nr:hypothetical protein [Daejeonella sp.]
MKYTYLFLISIIFYSCTAPSVKPAASYIDLKSFFQSEAQRLSKLNKPVEKTVSRNQVSQTKKLTGIDWANELTLFTESDINKPAWRDSYKTIHKPGELIYLALDSNLRTRKIRIKENENGRIQEVEILNYTKNQLYSSKEHLIYITDSLYRIDKQQHVLLLGDNRYEISGKIKF